MTEVLIHDLIIHSSPQKLTVSPSYFEDIKEAKEIIRKRAKEELVGIIPEDAEIVVNGFLPDVNLNLPRAGFFPNSTQTTCINFYVYIKENSELIPIWEYRQNKKDG